MRRWQESPCEMVRNRVIGSGLGQYPRKACESDPPPIFSSPRRDIPAFTTEFLTSPNLGAPSTSKWKLRCVKRSLFSNSFSCHGSWMNSRAQIQYAHVFCTDSRRKKWSDDADSTKMGQVAKKKAHTHMKTNWKMSNEVPDDGMAVLPQFMRTGLTVCFFHDFQR